MLVEWSRNVTRQLDFQILPNPIPAAKKNAIIRGMNTLIKIIASTDQPHLPVHFKRYN